MELAKGIMKWADKIESCRKLDNRKYRLELKNGYVFTDNKDLVSDISIKEAQELLKHVTREEKETKSTTQTFGYIRVSTKEQNESRQVDALGGCDKVFIDKLSGKDTNRPEFQNMIEQLRKGDTIRVISLDRLSRNKQDIVDLYELLKKKSCFIEVIDMPVISTKGKSDIELGLIVPLVVQLLGYMAEQERKNILSRQAQGIKAMKVNEKGQKIGKTGKPMGRPSALDSLTGRELKLINRWLDKNDKDYKFANVKLDTGLGKTTLYKIKNELSEKK